MAVFPSASRDDADTAKRNRIARLHDRSLAGRDLEIGFVAILDASILLPPRVHLAVIEEPLEMRDRVGRRRAADVVAVVVGRKEVVDLREARGLHRVGDAFRVALRRGPWAPAVDQHRIARRGDDQRRTAPFDVEDTDLQAIRWARLHHAHNRGNQQGRPRLHRASLGPRVRFRNPERSSVRFTIFPRRLAVLLFR